MLSYRFTVNERLRVQMDDKGPLHWRVPQVKENPALNRWFVRYTVGIENAPSIRVIEYFGFHYQGEQIDEEDGPESIYEISREEFLGKFGASQQMQGGRP